MHRCGDEAGARAVPREAPPPAGAGKADFDDLYDMPHPGELARTLAALDYEIPQQAAPVFRALLTAARGAPTSGTAPRRQRVVDLCCSYGFTAALLRHDLTLAQLLQQWAGHGRDAPSHGREAADAAFFAARRRPDAPRVDGLDVAGAAVGYARRVGLLDAGWVEDLERHEPSPRLHAELLGTDLVTVTGGVGYITERTVERVLAPGGAVPWVAAFVLRVYGYDRIAAALARHGLVTERLDGHSFPQRRFVSAAEREAAVRDVRARGLDPAGLEAAGRYHADLFVSRPPQEVTRAPLQVLLRGVLPAPWLRGGSRHVAGPGGARRAPDR